MNVMQWFRCFSAGHHQEPSNKQNNNYLYCITIYLGLEWKMICPEVDVQVSQHSDRTHLYYLPSYIIGLAQPTTKVPWWHDSWTSWYCQEPLRTVWDMVSLAVLWHAINSMSTLSEHGLTHSTQANLFSFHQWQTIVFSDESRYILHRADGSQWVFRCIENCMLEYMLDWQLILRRHTM